MSDKDCIYCKEVVEQLKVLNSHLERLVNCKQSTVNTPQYPKPKPQSPVVHKPTAEPEFPKGEHPILAPMPGIVISYEKKVGDAVKVGDTVVVLEAMKMYNNLCASVDGVVKALPFSPGDNVKKFDALCVIEN